MNPWEELYKVLPPTRKFPRFYEPESEAEAMSLMVPQCVSALRKLGVMHPRDAAYVQDVVQAFMIGVVDAFRRTWDRDKGPFSAHAYYRGMAAAVDEWREIRGQLHGITAYEQRKGNVPRRVYGTVPDSTAPETVSTSGVDLDKSDCTPRQKAIMRMHSEGFSMQEIAEVTGIKKQTVNYHLKRVSTTMGAV